MNGWYVAVCVPSTFVASTENQTLLKGKQPHLINKEK